MPDPTQIQAGASPQPGMMPQPTPTPGAAPAASPMSTPNNADGEKAGAKMWVAHVAIPALEQALVAWGSSTQEGKAILTSLRALSSHFGSEGKESLDQSTIMQLMGQSPRM